MVRKNSTQNGLFCLVILLLLLAAYSNSFENSFQHDDIHGIVSNPYMKDPANMGRFFTEPKTGSGIYGEVSSGYRPFLLASYSLNYLLGGLNVFGYHLVNFLFHLLCTLMVYFLLLHLLDATGPPAEAKTIRHSLIAFFAALIFGLHPVQTESVTYISGRSSALMAFFFLASFLMYSKYRFGSSRWWLPASGAAYACALLTKETAITLLPVLMVFALLFPTVRSPRRRYLSLAGHVLITFGYLGARIYLFKSLQYGSGPVRPFYENLLTQSRAWVHYLGTFLLPLNLNIDYDFPPSQSIAEGPVLLSLSVLAALSLLIWRLSRTQRVAGFFALWLGINLLPTNSIIPLEDVVSDRWLYLSCVGYAVLLSAGAAWWFQSRVEFRGRAAKAVFFFLCMLVVEGYGFSTLLRNFDWRSQRALWADAVVKSPTKARPYNGLGVGLLLQGRLEEAKGAFQKAISLEPRGGQPYLNLGYTYSLQGNWERAVEYYEKAVPLSPLLLSDIYSRLGQAYFRLGKMDEAEKYLRAAIDIRPHNAAPHYVLGLYFEKGGNMEQAIFCLEKAKKLDPDYLPPYEALSRIYRNNGESERSREIDQEFLRLSSR